MDLNWTDYIGSIAGFLTTVSFVPQAYRVYKTKDTDSISIYMFVIFNLGIIAWFTYGILLDQLPIIIANMVTFIFAFYILCHKIKSLTRKT
jgi:MtN3 and saliva related transmembrane protein